MSLKAKLSLTKYIKIWNYIVMENVERKKSGNNLRSTTGLCFRFPV